MIALLSSIIAVCMAVGVMFLRFKAAKKPVTKKKIILPPIFMSTGAMMYFLPEFRLTSLEIVEAISIGLIFSIFLIKTTKFEIRSEYIYETVKSIHIYFSRVIGCTSSVKIIFKSIN